MNGVTKHIPAMLPLQLTDIDFKNKQNTIRRLKGSRDTTQPFINHRGKPLLSDESAIREYLAERIDDGSGLLFTGQKGPLSRWTLDEMFKKYCREASAQRVEKGFPAIPEEAMHFHTIRHTTGHSSVPRLTPRYSRPPRGSGTPTFRTLRFIGTLTLVPLVRTFSSPWFARSLDCD